MIKIEPNNTKNASLELCLTWIFQSYKQSLRDLQSDIKQIFMMSQKIQEKSWLWDMHFILSI